MVITTANVTSRFEAGRRGENIQDSHAPFYRELHAFLEALGRLLLLFLCLMSLARWCKGGWETGCFAFLAFTVEEDLGQGLEMSVG